MVLAPETTLSPYLRYRYVLRVFEEKCCLIRRSRESVMASPALRNRTKNPANEQYLFHGTNRYCRLVEDGSRLRLCNLSKCHLCSILRDSFDVSRCGEFFSTEWLIHKNSITPHVNGVGSKHKFRRFGTGIYTSTCSSSKNSFHISRSLD